MEHHTAGDPINGLRWTRKTTLKISAELHKAGIVVSPKTVARLLRGLKFSLRVNHKKVAGKSSPFRNQQFEYINRMRRRFERQGWPAISIDTKKRELVGRFKNAGTTWETTPVLVNDHDFRTAAQGVAIPWGLYDTQANRGHVFIGTSHDTPAFSVTALAQWWISAGRRRYPYTKRLLILADCGGSNGARTRGWKYELQTRLCDRFGLTLTVCHYPPRYLQVEPHRASPLQRDQQELGWPTSRELRDRAQLYSHHENLDRSRRQCHPARRRLPDRH